MAPSLASDALSLKLDCARWWALREQPFYGQLACGLTDTFDDSIPTASTDGRVIRWNRDFLSKLTPEETRFIVLHETLHCAHGHLWRLPPNKLGNQAADYCINDTLAQVEGLAMPEGGLTMPAEFRDMAEEEIYSALSSQQNPESGQNGADDSAGDQPGSPTGDFSEPAEGEGEDTENVLPGSDPEQDGDEGSAAEQPGDSLQDQWERRLIQSQQAAQATGQGSSPADLARALARVKAQEIDWRREMADFVRDAASSRNDWSRAARRHAWQSVIYPRRRAVDLGLVVLCRDTSGSIDDALLTEFSALISACLADSGCRGLVIDCDCEVQQVIELAPGEECPTDAKGGGGTSHEPIWAKLKELSDEGERIAGVVCLTDMLTDFPADDEGFATLWLATTDRKAPFGRTVRVKV